MEEINKMDKFLASCVENKVDELIIRRSNVVSSMWRNLEIKDDMLIQKARIRWTRDGDLRTKYFHNFVKGRRNKRKIIGSLNMEMGILESVGEVKEEISDFSRRSSLNLTLIDICWRA